MSEKVSVEINPETHRIYEIAQVESLLQQLEYGAAENNKISNQLAENKKRERILHTHVKGIVTGLGLGNGNVTMADVPRILQSVMKSKDVMQHIAALAKFVEDYEKTNVVVMQPQK